MKGKSLNTLKYVLFLLPPHTHTIKGLSFYKDIWAELSTKYGGLLIMREV